MKGKVYFVSDFHFGIPDKESSRQREARFIGWLESIEKEAEAIFLMGDLFDFWFEYKTVVPKGYARLFGKLAALSDAGISIHLFRGNHDIWAFDYLEEEIGIQLHRNPEVIYFDDTAFYLAHGDGLGPGDQGYKVLKKVFECRLCQFLFRWLHPDLGTRMGLYFSGKSRLANLAREKNQLKYPDPESEMIVRFAREKISSHPEVKYFVFGHRHRPLVHSLNAQTRLILLGDWLMHYTYGVFDGKNFELKHFEPDAAHSSG
jgi:UDP-2,3-diacylglucosamine hydrolase